MKIQKPTYIYRIIHKENLQILIDEGKLVAPSLAKNKNYIPIGDQKVIKLRGNKKVMLPPFGTINDYISFYFGVRTPMLYCIANGYNVPKLDQENIIYLVSSIDKLVNSQTNFVFTDGHSYAAYTKFFNDIKYLTEIDWKVVYSSKWHNTNYDSDRKRRKSAECLVYQKLKIDDILEIVVYNLNAYNYISTVIKKNNLKIPLSIKSEWYY